MKQVIIALSIILLFLDNVIHAQPAVRGAAGMISLDGIAPTEKKYSLFTDTLEKRLKANPS